MEETDVVCPQCDGEVEMCNGYCNNTGWVPESSATEWYRQNPEPESQTSKHCDSGYMNDMRFGGY